VTFKFVSYAGSDLSGLNLGGGGNGVPDLDDDLDLEAVDGEPEERARLRLANRSVFIALLEIGYLR
jgi:hypothetical protein